jgi:hypothetical protein
MCAAEGTPYPIDEGAQSLMLHRLGQIAPARPVDESGELSGMREVALPHLNEFLAVFMNYAGAATVDVLSPAPPIGGFPVLFRLDARFAREP